MKRRSTPLNIVRKINHIIYKAQSSKTRDELDHYMYELMDKFPGDSGWLKFLADIEASVLLYVQPNYDKDDDNEELQGSCDQERKASQI